MRIAVTPELVPNGWQEEPIYLDLTPETVIEIVALHLRSAREELDDGANREQARFYIGEAERWLAMLTDA